MLVGVVFWQAWSSDRQLRKQFFITFGLSWLLIGNVAGLLFASAGPCYCWRVTGSPQDPYAPLMDYLHEANQEYPIWSLVLQEKLWKYYEDDGFASIATTGPSDGPAGSAVVPQDSETNDHEWAK